jgi:hypothetical protein
MSSKEIHSIKEKMVKKEIINNQKIIENPIIINSILKRKLNTHNAMKSLNSEISYKIKDNIALDIFNNNANTLSSLLSKRNNNGGDYIENQISKPKQQSITKTIETYGKHHHQFLTRPLEEINNGGSETNTNIDTIYRGITNSNTIENNRRNKNIYNGGETYFSPYLLKNEKKMFIENNGYNNKIYEIEHSINSNILKKMKNINGGEQVNNNKSLKTINMEEINEIKDENNENKNKKRKIYIKKPIKINQNKKNILKKEKEKNTHFSNFSNIPTSNEILSTDYDKETPYREKDKYLSLLNNYRKSVIKQFMFYFKPYCYYFIKIYFNIFISNLKSIKNKKISEAKRYTKKINKRNLNDGKIVKDLKLIQLNYSNNNFTNISNNETENSNNYINSYNSKKNINENNNSNTIKKLRYILINNNIKFSLKDSLKNRNNELFRNNLELLKKHTQIIKRKRRKKIINDNNIYINGDYSNCQIYNENKTIDVSQYKNKNYTVNNSYERRKKINYSPNTHGMINSYNFISNGDLNKEESIKMEKKNINKIKSLPKREKEKSIKIKHKIKMKTASNSRPISQKRNEENKYNKNKYITMHKKNKKIIVISRKDKINNINNLHYNKNYISKKIKNIFTRDKKINIHINYVFFIPPKQDDKKKLEKKYKYLKISQTFSFTYIGNFNPKKNKNKLYSKKRLSSIKEEEEKSKCSISMSMILQNAKTIDENNSILNYLIDKIYNYYILKMKTSFLYNLKVINLNNQLDKIFKNNIFKLIKFINKDDEKDNNTKGNGSNDIFLVDDKIIMNINNINYNIENNNKI